MILYTLRETFLCTLIYALLIYVHGENASSSSPFPNEQTSSPTNNVPIQKSMPIETTPTAPEPIAPTEKCVKDADPFLWITSIYDMDTVLFYCDFYRNMSYQCITPVVRVQSDSLAEEEPQPVAIITIDFATMTGIAFVNVTCPDLPNNTPSCDSTDPQDDAMAAVSLLTWDVSDGIITNGSLGSENNYSTVAKCFFTKKMFECFGLPTCPGDCMEPCFGGEPWRGNYLNDTKKIPGGRLTGTITAQAQAGSGSGPAAPTTPATPAVEATEATSTFEESPKSPTVSTGLFSVCKSDNAVDCLKLRAHYQDTGKDRETAATQMCQHLLPLLNNIGN